MFNCSVHSAHESISGEVRLTKDFCLSRLLLCLLFLAACSSGPIAKEYRYKGEPLNKLGPYGLVVGHAVVPVDKFPFDRKTTILYLENIKTKKQYHYGDTQGPFFMKLPPGDYVLNEMWAGGGCNTSTGLMISTFFSELPDSVAHLRNQIEKPATLALGFRVHEGKMTDIGNLLLTCFEWDAREKFKKEFTRYIEDGEFQVYRTMNADQYDCGCKILRKFDGTPVREMNRVLKQD